MKDLRLPPVKSTFVSISEPYVNYSQEVDLAAGWQSPRSMQRILLKFDMSPLGNQADVSSGLSSTVFVLHKKWMGIVDTVFDNVRLGRRESYLGLAAVHKTQFAGHDNRRNSNGVVLLRCYAAAAKMDGR